jgi:hypothetical protein
MPEKPDDDPFHDCELGPDAVLETRTFRNVLFTEDTETPVNVLTDENPFADDVEESDETNSKPRENPIARLRSSPSRRPGRSNYTGPTTPLTTRTRALSTSKRTTSRAT